MKDSVTQNSVWADYYERFPYFSADRIRSGCEPRKYVHPGGSEKAIVLIHGLTDSPYAMLAIGHYFYELLGYDVYLPLLQCHGLKDPGKMEGVSLAEWKKNVQFAVHEASQNGARVSIGGLSTGGALGFYFTVTDNRVAGELYLFSAAFGLYGGPYNLLSTAVEYLLTNPVLHLTTSSLPLVADNPYRYARVPLNSAKELVALMWENNVLLDNFAIDKRFDTKVFSAWSAADTVVSIDAIHEFHQIVGPENVSTFEIEEDKNVHHACVVLEEPIYAVDSGEDAEPLEPPNPNYQEMMEALRGFESSSH